MLKIHKTNTTNVCAQLLTEGLGGGQYRTTPSQHKPRQDSKRQRTTTKKSTARHNTTNHTTTNNRRGHTTNTHHSTITTSIQMHPKTWYRTPRRIGPKKKNNPATSVNTSLFLVNNTENRQPWIARHTQRTLKELPCRTATLRCQCQRLEYLRVVLKLGHIRGRVAHKIESIAVCT